jgi:hypothetical protein
MSIHSKIEIHENHDDNNNYKEDNDRRFMIGGYAVDKLLEPNSNVGQHGGGNAEQSGPFNEMLIPLGLYCEKTPITDFYEKKAKYSVIDDSLFDTLFNSVSKNKSRATRKNVKETNETLNKTTRRNK